MGDIVLRIKNGLVIDPSVTAVSTILGLTAITAFTPLVSRPRIVRLFLGFTLSIVSTILLRGLGSYVAGCPFDAQA